MKYAYQLAFVATAVTALTISQHRPNAFDEQIPVSQERFLIELQPGETRWVTEDEKWELRRVISVRTVLTGHHR